MSSEGLTDNSPSLATRRCFGLLGSCRRSEVDLAPLLLLLLLSLLSPMATASTCVFHTSSMVAAHTSRSSPPRKVPFSAVNLMLKNRVKCDNDKL